MYHPPGTGYFSALLPPCLWPGRHRPFHSMVNCSAKPAKATSLSWRCQFCLGLIFSRRTLDDIFIYVYTYVHIIVYIYIHIGKYASAYVYIYREIVYLFIYSFIYIFLHIRTYASIYIYIYMPQNLQDSSHRTAIWSEMHVKFWSPETQNTKQDLV